MVERRIDMLPKPLTEDICSLRADVERLAFSVLWVRAMTSLTSLVHKRAFSFLIGIWSVFGKFLLTACLVMYVVSLSSYISVVHTGYQDRWLVLWN
jgi:hypothetical protein